MSDDDVIIIRRIGSKLRQVWRNHGTKIIGYVTMAAGAVAVMDPRLVAETLGPHAMQWALLITGLAAVGRGHTNKVPGQVPQQ